MSRHDEVRAARLRADAPPLAAAPLSGVVAAFVRDLAAATPAVLVRVLSPSGTCETCGGTALTAVGERDWAIPTCDAHLSRSYALASLITHDAEEHARQAGRPAASCHVCGGSSSVMVLAPAGYKCGACYIGQGPKQ